MEPWKSANQIFRNIWLGSAVVARDINFIEQENIGAIINCAKEEPFISAIDLLPKTEEDSLEYEAKLKIIKNLYKFKVPLDDDPSEIDNFIKLVPQAARRIHKLLNKGKVVYIHCQCGINRSAIVIK